MKALRLTSHVKDAEAIKFEMADLEKPVPNQNECLIKVVASGINPSDALATLGYFQHASLPRIPGRDFSGTVVTGPKDLIGQNVWGTGGAAGISYDGTQTEYIKLPLTAITPIPNNMDVITAGAQLLPYVTAYYSLVKRAAIQANETVVVVGALGQVGQAAMSICHWKKCKTIALIRGKDELAQAKKLGWNTVNSEDTELAEKILAANAGQKVNVILNSVGTIYWTDFMKSLAEFGRIITIGARENNRETMVNLFELYRANQELIGINSVSLDFTESAELLNELREGFEAKQLTPLATDAALTFSPEQAHIAYQTVLKGASGGKRVVIKFD